MEKIEENEGITGVKTALIPGSLFTSTAIPTSYATFSTDCEKPLARAALHLGFIIEFSPYQQA